MQNISKDMEKFLNASRVGSGLTHYLQAEGFLPATAPKRRAGLPASKPQGRPAGCSAPARVRDTTKKELEALWRLFLEENSVKSRK